jgi:hypothetical protein
MQDDKRLRDFSLRYNFEISIRNLKSLRLTIVFEINSLGEHFHHGGHAG